MHSKINHLKRKWFFLKDKSIPKPMNWKNKTFNSKINWIRPKPNTKWPLKWLKMISNKKISKSSIWMNKSISSKTVLIPKGNELLMKKTISKNCTQKIKGIFNKTWTPWGKKNKKLNNRSSNSKFRSRNKRKNFSIHKEDALSWAVKC
jgi:hypothetical protein